ncbi:MAG: tetratricopeptide (TPR) repeat protein [Myxococcota bacterium]|jgi:tetratricopeptide (TPR) repeat protein
MIGLVLLLTASADPDALLLPVSGSTRMLLIAEEWEATGDLEKAERQYRRLLRADPTDDGAALGLARVLVRRGNRSEAIATYRLGILDYEPEAVEALAGLLEEKSPEEAAALYRKTRQLNRGRDPSPWLLAEARCLCRAERLEDSMAALRSFLKKSRSPSGAESVLLCHAIWHYEADDVDTASAMLREILRLEPEALDPAIIEEAQARLDRIQVIAQARRMSHGGGRGLTAGERVRVDAALDSARSGRLEEATRSLRLVVADAPEATEAWASLGDVLSADDRIADAERAYVIAVALSPEDPRWHARLGLLLADAYRGRRHVEAAEELRSALELRPSWGEIRFRLAEVQHGLCDFEDAAQTLDAYLAGEPEGVHALEAAELLAGLRREVPTADDLPDPTEGAAEVAPAILERFHVAKVYWNQGKTDAARSELDALLGEAPEWHRAYNLQAMMAQTPADAVVAWEQSLDLRADQPQIQTSLGEELRRQGETRRGLMLLMSAADGGSAEAQYLLAENAFQHGDFETARKRLGEFFLSSYGGPFYEPAQALRDKLERRRLQRRQALGVVAGLLSLTVLVWWVRRRQGRTLDDLLTAAPECAHDLARLLAAIRHEVLKHNTTLLEEMAHAFSNGDYSAVRWAAERLFGDGESEGVIERYTIYRAGIERLGRKHGVRLDLRRSDPVFSPMSQAMQRLSALQPKLLRPERARDLEGPLLALSEALNVDAYRALGRLISSMGTVMIDASVIRPVDARVRDEPGLAEQTLPELSVAGEPLPARVFRGDLDDIVANLLRNAYFALLEAPPQLRRVGVVLEEDDDPITGLELVVLRFCDTAPGTLTDAMIQSRSIGRGLGLAVDLITRHNGSITVEDEPGYSKAVVVRLPRAEEDEEPPEPMQVAAEAWVMEED